jgi:hypothetical protein
MANTSTYLNRTTGTSTLNTKCTFSGWYKRGALTGAHQHIFSIGTSSGAQLRARFRTTDAFQVYGNITGQGEIQFITNRLFRDTSAWYHILISIDCTQSAANRVKIYVNGIEETSFDGTTQAEITSMDVLDNNTFEICRRAETDDTYFDGYMSHVAFVDGQALAPTVFGETDSTSGIWKFKAPSGVTWGTNGFHLKFENSGNLGLDSSGNSNTFTVNGNGRQALDTPTNVHATWNGVMAFAGSGTFSNGNTEWNSGADTNRFWCTSSIGVSTGKWYVEMKNTVQAGHNLIGIAPRSAPALDWYLGGSGNVANADDNYQWGYKAEDGNIVNNTNSTSYGNTYGTTDIIGVALDLDNNKLYFSKNGTWQNSGVPTSGSTGTGAVSITSASSNPTGVYHIVGANATSGDASTFQANFGNGYFGTTAISSAGSNGNGSLFEYDVPSGYYALNTKNINTYG